MTKVIYEPKGKAREYSPLALNLYLKCSHGCKYCYAPKVRFDNDYFSEPFPRKDVLVNLEKQLKKERIKKQVLLSFIGDVYCDTKDKNETTRKALEILLENKVPVAILTKNERILNDIELIKKFDEHIQIGSTLTFYDQEKSLEWEPGASTPKERLNFLKKFHDEGIRTFASFEPVIEPNESLKLIKESIDFIDIYKVGKLNNYKGIDKSIDWTDFLEKVVYLLRKNKKSFYIKHDLRVSAPSIKLFGNEVLSDEHNVF